MILKKKSLKYLNTIGRYSLLIPIGILFIILVFYLSAPVYRFDEPQVFQGEKLYNPYQNINPAHWRKYNFQVQSKAWGGLTDGRLNSNALIKDTYNKLGFDHVATSDYQKINQFGNEKLSFIPTYEHGYGIRKTHQVCIGASKVLWIDYPFYQSLSHKQGIIDRLGKDCDLIALAHPLLLGGYTFEDMKYLSGYQLMEVLTNMRVSVDHWDTALSYGHRIYIIANDDAHDVSNSNEVGRRFTLINASDLKRETITQALDAGAAYGMDFIRIDDEPMEDKIERSRHIPYLQQASLSGDTFTISVDQIADSIRFVGQNAKLLKLAKNSFQANYIIQPSDTYIRTEIHFQDKSVIYLNPVTRHKDLGQLSRQRLGEVHKLRTTLYRIFNFSALGLFLFLIYSKRKKYRKQQK
jgi:hypothetical protein